MRAGRAGSLRQQQETSTRRKKHKNNNNAVCINRHTVTVSATTAAAAHNVQNNQDDFTRLTALRWLRELALIAGAALAPRYAPLIGAALANVGHPSREIRQVGARSV